MSSLSEEDRANLVAYLDGELNEESTQALEARLGQDPIARAELESLKQVYGLLDYLPRPQPSESFTHRTMERLSFAEKPRTTGKMPLPRRTPWLGAAAWVGGLVLVLAVGWVSGRFLWGQNEEVETSPPPASAPDLDKDWLPLQARTIRAKVESLKGKERDGFIDDVKAREQKWKEEWLIAARFWNELQKGAPLPAHPGDFPEFVENYLKDYLRHFLDKEELNRLAQAEGQWPLYPITLVELADRHPPALPGPNGHRRFDELPLPVQKLFKTKAPLARALKASEGTWPGFARDLAQLAERRGIQFPNELWPSSYKALNPDMKEFVDKLIHEVLTDEEKHQLLNKTPNRWPDYPMAIQELARAHRLDPPWFVLPGSRDMWDKYRVRK